MPLQNRLTPFGEIIATKARGTMMGNRGGKFHRDERRWASRHWICCDLHYKGHHHEPMGKGYTSLFFLDEVTALAAGHRPCFYCRRTDARRFLGLAEPPLSADEADRIVHRQRVASAPGFVRHEAIVALPDGVMIAMGDQSFAIRGSHLLRWSPSGYTDIVPRASAMSARLLTPPLYVHILARGYEPRWHDLALKF
jgi:hypothetical protein